MFQLINPDTNYDFLGKSKPFVWASTFLALLSLLAVVKPGFNYGIDFTGGGEVQLKVPKTWKIDDLRGHLQKGGIHDPKVVTIGEPDSSEYLLRIQSGAEGINGISDKVNSILKKEAGEGQYEISRVDVVGPQAGAALRNGAFLSIIYATLLIVAFIAFRFDFRFAPGVLRALLFDVLITMGFWVAFGLEFNLTVLAAFLTVAGYSCNDTIVIYDRIRDFTRSHPDWTLEKAVNKSINLNLGRTVLTVGSTLIVVSSMFFLGGPVLRDFALPMLIGFSISVPSALFVANPLIIYMENRRLAKLRGNH